MNGFRLEIRPSVKKALRKIRNAKLQQRLDEAFIKLAENPRRMGVEKMAGFVNRYRFRVGDYRIVYEIHDDILLVDFGHRRPQRNLSVSQTNSFNFIRFPLIPPRLAVS